jgi:hypothetical protein
MTDIETIDSLYRDALKIVFNRRTCYASTINQNQMGNEYPTERKAEPDGFIAKGVLMQDAFDRLLSLQSDPHTKMDMLKDRRDRLIGLLGDSDGYANVENQAIIGALGQVNKRLERILSKIKAE